LQCFAVTVRGGERLASASGASSRKDVGSGKIIAADSREHCYQSHNATHSQRSKAQLSYVQSCQGQLLDPAGSTGCPCAHALRTAHCAHCHHCQSCLPVISNASIHSSCRVLCLELSAIESPPGDFEGGLLWLAGGSGRARAPTVAVTTVAGVGRRERSRRRRRPSPSLSSAHLGGEEESLIESSSRRARRGDSSRRLSMTDSRQLPPAPVRCSGSGGSSIVAAGPRET
jgi:hypothetical protein